MCFKRTSMIHVGRVCLLSKESGYFVDHRPIKQAAESPVLLGEEVDSEVDEEHSQGVVEETQREDGVDAI